MRVRAMVQEAYETIHALREACGRSIAGHAAALEADVQAVIDERGVSHDWSAKSLALHMQVHGLAVEARELSASHRSGDDVVVPLSATGGHTGRLAHGRTNRWKIQRIT